MTKPHTPIRTRTKATQAPEPAVVTEPSARAVEPIASTQADHAPPRPPGGKLAVLIDLLRRPEGARVDQMMGATGWQAHSVRGAMSGALKKKQGLNIASEKTGGERVHRIVDEAAR